MEQIIHVWKVSFEDGSFDAIPEVLGMSQDEAIRQAVAWAFPEYSCDCREEYEQKTIEIQKIARAEYLWTEVWAVI